MPRFVKLTVSQETEYHRLLHSATEELYENIYEMDISRNRAGGETTRRYFESLGIGADGSYNQALEAFSRKIKEEYVAGYWTPSIPLMFLTLLKKAYTT